MSRVGWPDLVGVRTVKVSEWRTYLEKEKSGEGYCIYKIKFSFDSKVTNFPSIQVPLEGGGVCYPRTGKATVTGVEIITALEAKAKITFETGI